MKTTLLTTVISGLMLWNSAAQNLLVNGGFEDPVLTSWGAYGPGTNVLTGWEVAGDGVQHFNPPIYGGSGSQTLQMTANYGAGGTVSQTITTDPGAFYIVSLDVGSRTGSDVNGTVKFGDTEFPFSVVGPLIGSTNVTNLTFNAEAPSASTTLEVTGGNPAGGSMLLIIDNVSVVQAVPGAVEAATSKVEAWQGAVAADGVSFSTITAALTDATGIPVSGKTVSLAKTSGPGTPVITTVSGTTGGGGKAVFQVASTTPGEVVFTATDETDTLVVTDTATVNFLAGSVANSGTSTVVAAPTSLPANGVATSAVTVTLKDVNNGPVSGKTVALAQTLGPGDAVITTVSGTSDASGQASFTVASMKSGDYVFSATDVTDSNIVISNAAAVTFTVGPVDANISTVVASPPVVPADNSSASTITVTLRDATSNGVPNKVVSLAQTGGQGSPSIITVSDTTDANGEAIFTATSITPGTSILTATDMTDGNLVVTQTVELTFVSLVSWSGFATTVANDTDVVTNGILRYAEHWAGIDSTVNGVTFTAAQNNVIGSSDGYETLEETNGYPQGSLSTPYWNILRGKWYRAGNGETVTLNGLQEGRKYLLQIWSSDPRYGPTQEQLILPGFALNIHEGQYGVGTFTATGPTQVLGLAGDGVLNAVQVRELGSVALNSGPGAGQLTLTGFTENPGSIVTEKATQLTSPVTWMPIQTNQVTGGNYSFTIPADAEAQAFFRTSYTSP